jgi:spore germination protein PC
MQPADIHAYFQQLQAYLQWQTDRIRELEQKVTMLDKEVEALRKQRGITIEKIEYTFDQLKVDKLEGTLNVGISPSGLSDKSLDDLTVGGKEVVNNTAISEGFQRIHGAVLSYLEREGPGELQRKAEEYDSPLEEDMQDQMLADLRGQIGERIDAYTQLMKDNKTGMLPPDKEQMVTDKVVHDIRLGIEQYFRNKAGKGKDTDDSAGRE